MRKHMHKKKRLEKTVGVFNAGAADALLKEIIRDAKEIAGETTQITAQHIGQCLADSSKKYHGIVPPRIANIYVPDQAHLAEAEEYRQQQQDSAAAAMDVSEE